MKKELNIYEIMDYANKNRVDLKDPNVSDLPDDQRGGLMEQRVRNPDIETYGTFDNDMIGIFGVQPVNNFTGETFGTSFEESHRKTYLRLSRMFIELWLQDYHRLQTLINENDEKAYRFNKLLGFKEEARIKQLTEDDYFLLRRLRGDD